MSQADYLLPPPQPGERLSPRLRKRLTMLATSRKLTRPLAADLLLIARGHRNDVVAALRSVEFNALRAFNVATFMGFTATALCFQWTRDGAGMVTAGLALSTVGCGLGFCAGLFLLSATRQRRKLAEWDCLYLDQLINPATETLTLQELFSVDLPPERRLA